MTSPKVRDASLLSEDFAAGQLPQGERGPAGEPGARGEPGPPGPAGRDGILDAIGRSTASPGVGCVPSARDTDPDPLECASVSLTLPRTARVHLVADADWGVYGYPPYAGECRLSLDGTPIPGGPVTHPGEFSEPIDFVRGPTGLAPVDHLAHLGLTHVTQPLSPGTYRFGLLCHDTNDSIMIRNESISALAISPN